MIGDEAVEAATEAVKVFYDGKPPRGARAATRLALEAASPHLFAQLLALADERDETPGAIRGHITTYELRQAINPYRSQP